MAFRDDLLCENFNDVLNDSYQEVSNFASSLPDFTVNRLIGSGGFGSVFLGRFGGTKVAIKTLHKSTKNKSASLESFRGELNAVGLHHDSIVNTLATTPVDEFESGAFIIMEYVGRRNLLQAINDPSTSMPVSKCARYGIDVCRALQYLHTNGIIHLDVKPANIFITNNGRCKLGDFGCSQKVSADRGTVAVSNATSALTGTVVYRAPELLRGKAPTVKADVYSMGITLWQMLTRETPFAGQDLHAIVFGVVAYNRRPSFPEQDISNCRWYEDLCAICWGGTPQNRPDAEGVVSRLKQQMEGYGNIDNA